jgi:hypothetical protein
MTAIPFRVPRAPSRYFQPSMPVLKSMNKEWPVKKSIPITFETSAPVVVSVIPEAPAS